MSVSATTRRPNKLTTYFRVLGIRVHAVQIPDVVQQMERWITEKEFGHFVTLTNVHSVIEAQQNDLFHETLLSADLSVPDGMPLVWVGRLRGHSLQRRVYGPDLLADFLRITAPKGYRHYFYGGAPGIADRMVEEMRKNIPELTVVGTYSPPFRPMTPEEDAAIVEKINQAKPDVLWVGLGCPKQEIWMFQHRQRLQVPVLVGVGQAFNIYAGDLRQAPPWMRENGLEWFFRLLLEPRRLWRRYLLYNTKFLFYLLLEAAGLKRFS
ncbi:MAG: hypothetical protein A3F68_00945 [Acidobacteria bacterium RIFCSPLOWO2_12_FULL_54_10]|nr:MAG: hypothetical protein A3F68_00945 [Acidobacteria bacterium RIFCSPLOWO2_12_FULL_54_10]